MVDPDFAPLPKNWKHSRMWRWGWSTSAPQPQRKKVREAVTAHPTPGLPSATLGGLPKPRAHQCDKRAHDGHWAPPALWVTLGEFPLRSSLKEIMGESAGLVTTCIPVSDNWVPTCSAQEDVPKNRLPLGTAKTWHSLTRGWGRVQGSLIWDLRRRPCCTIRLVSLPQPGS